MLHIGVMISNPLYIKLNLLVLDTQSRQVINHITLSQRNHQEQPTGQDRSKLWVSLTQKDPTSNTVLPWVQSGQKNKTESPF